MSSTAGHPVVRQTIFSKPENVINIQKLILLRVLENSSFRPRWAGERELWLETWTRIADIFPQCEKRDFYMGTARTTKLIYNNPPCRHPLDKAVDFVKYPNGGNVTFPPQEGRLSRGRGPGGPLGDDL